MQNDGSMEGMAARSLYWNHISNYEECPQKALWTSGWETIDLGNGLGKAKTKPLDKSRHHAVMGLVIGRVLEDFYNLEEWKHPEGLHERLIRATKDRLSEYCIGEYIDWHQSPPYDELETVCVEGVLGYLKTMRQHKLLGAYARSEVQLMGYINKWLPIAGRADFIFRRDDVGVTILDGKNSGLKMKYVDPDQLRWYALCYALSYQKIPDRLGFVWYRYPYDEAAGEQGLDWVPFSRRDLRELVERAQEVRKGQQKEKFGAVPKASVCRFCDFESVCPERQFDREMNRQKRSAKGLPIVEDTFEGVAEFGFDSDFKKG